MYTTALEKASHGMVAKTDSIDVTLYLPSWMHALDTAGVMEYLFDEWVPKNVMHRLTEEIDKMTLKRTCLFIALTNDIGMHTASFQSMVLRKISGYKYSPLKIADLPEKQSTYMSHAQASEAILRKYGVPESISAIIGAHHGVPQDNDCLVSFEISPRNFYGKVPVAVWEQYWHDFIDASLQACDFHSVSELPEIPMSLQFLITGLLVMADWIASNQYYFPLISTDSCGSVHDYPTRADTACQRLGIEATWSYNDTANLLAQQGISENGVQSALIETAQNSIHPGVFIVEAPSACQISEAAVTASEIVAKKVGCKGLFYGLPLQAASVETFTRIKSQIAYPTDDSEDGLISQGWYTHYKKVLLQDFVVDTIEPLLMLALQSRHIMLHHIGIAGKVVIIDNVQLCNEHMQKFLDRTLNWLGDYEVPVIITASSLSTNRRKELIQAYLQGRSHRKAKLRLPEEDWQSEWSNPLLTWTEDMSVHQKVFSNSSPGKSILTERVRRQNFRTALRIHMPPAGCAGVIFNSVEDAQTATQELIDDFPDKKIVLYHSQMLPMEQHRNGLVLDNIVKEKKSIAARKDVIVVGTPDLLLKYDLDFDVMAIELSPMDIFLECMSHLHRYERHRSPAADTPLCIVIEEFTKPTETMYGKWPLLQTKHLLPDVVVLPQDISSLVQASYEVPTDGSLSEDEYMLWEQYKVDFLSPNTAFLLTAPKYSRFQRTFHGTISVNPGNKESSSRWSVAGKDTSYIDVILLQTDGDGTVHMLSDPNRRFPVSFPPSEKECEMLRKQRIRLTGRLCEPEFTNALIAKSSFLGEWQKKGLLKNEIFLVLNDEKRVSVHGSPLCYSSELGLYIEAKDVK